MTLRLVQFAVLHSIGIACCLGGYASRVTADDAPIKLWPATAPGRIAADGNERNTSEPDKGLVAGKTVIRLGHVSEPSITVYRAPQDHNTGAAVLVCPGGGYNILAYDLEGTEVAEWLNTLGVTAVLLKYRVPRSNGEPAPIEPLQDAQRAISLVRSRAADWNIDAARIGVLGFSAGGHLAARLSTQHEHRAYAAVDQIDSVSCRPDFALLIYPAYLFDKASDELISAALPVDQKTPSIFLTMARDDPVDSENALRLALAMKRAHRPVELHLYNTGGHGYGLRRTESAATTWTDPAAAWLQPFTRPAAAQ
jgi:acetyl esterase/lipase